MPFGVALFRLDTVHPHVRGVYAPQGSPDRRRFRYIPTCVGFILMGDYRGYIITVQPHVRGVYSSGALSLMIHIGSTPRAWGISQRVVLHERRFRFIPTCVGYIKRFLMIKFVISVHPHVRGVYPNIEIPGCAKCGSSPRAWGILFRQKL